MAKKSTKSSEIKTADQCAFDRVATHLFTQGKRAIDGDMCLYRGPDGTKCAIGALIPDDHYKPDFEGGSARGLKYNGLLCLQGITGVLLTDLQMAHDFPENWRCEEDMKTVLLGVAVRYDLSPAVLADLHFSPAKARTE